MSRDPFYLDLIAKYSDPQPLPEDALCFLTWASENEVTDTERCAILGATLETVPERLKVLEAKAAEG